MSECLVVSRWFGICSVHTGEEKGKGGDVGFVYLK